MTPQDSWGLGTKGKLTRFEESMLPHMDAAYNLARWLTGNDSDAQDVVQEAFLRAFKFFGGFRGDNSRSWLLQIVRNTFYTWAEKNRREETWADPDDLIESLPSAAVAPDVRMVQEADSEAVRQAIESLPVEFREVLVMRELEGMAYKEIAYVADLPLGTVMSRLARGRLQLRNSLIERMGKNAGSRDDSQRTRVTQPRPQKD
jgi:RNA polymerase sigma-70 factor (ECF subfamily)